MVYSEYIRALFILFVSNVVNLDIFPILLLLTLIMYGFACWKTIKKLSVRKVKIKKYAEVPNQPTISIGRFCLSVLLSCNNID